ncbi:MAG TPA: serine/threonine-protein kinase [Polyangiales bacterium]|nr:serine/threonine-protein kinase [Polyangiales bacterium]
MAEPLTVIRERYRLDALIGEGGMAEVWRAWDLTLHRAVAVKLLFARDARDEVQLVERFLREARIAASVQHRNVIHIVDFGTTPENQPFMVMELLEGETLAGRLRRDKRMSVGDAVQIVNLTLRGLSAVHAAGIIHRDLKPDNVYLKTEGDFVYPKILDFGISRSIEPSSGQRSSTLATRDGVIVGTPEYMSPEQARGVKRLDYRTDIYSTGVMLYEALSGKLPYTSENVGDLIIKIVRGEAPKLHALFPEVALPISNVVSRAMSVQASDRFPDATAMQEALLEAAAQALGARAARALSDLPPQRPDSLRVLPSHLRTTRRPPSPMPRARSAAAAAPNNEPLSLPANDAPSLNPNDPSLQITRPKSPLPRTRAIDTSAPPTESTSIPNVPPPSAAWHTRLLQLLATAALLAVGGLLLWLAPSPPPPEPAPRAIARPAHPAAPIAPAAPMVRLQLRGLPDDATVTLDGEPASGDLSLPRDARAHALVVTAPNKTPWHVSYVANADQNLDVELEPSAPPPPSAARPKRATKRTKPRGHEALRVPDF